MSSEKWIDSHSVNCYFCQRLVDERECLPADSWNHRDGGNICVPCLDFYLKGMKQSIKRYRKLWGKEGSDEMP